MYRIKLKHNLDVFFFVSRYFCFFGIRWTYATSEMCFHDVFRESIVSSSEMKWSLLSNIEDERWISVEEEYFHDLPCEILFYQSDCSKERDVNK